MPLCACTHSWGTLTCHIWVGMRLQEELGKVGAINAVPDRPILQHA